MHSWLLWSLLAALLVLPVLLRLYVGDDEPDNAITQEQVPGDQEDGRAEIRTGTRPLAPGGVLRLSWSYVPRDGFGGVWAVPDPLK